MKMSDLKDLIDKDLNQEIPRDLSKAREHIAKAEAALRDENPEVAAMQYGAATRLDPTNRETKRAYELVSNYVKGKILFVNNSAAAVEHLKEVVAIDRNFRSARNMLKTAAVLADNWETLSEGGILASDYVCSFPHGWDKTRDSEPLAADIRSLLIDRFYKESADDLNCYAPLFFNELRQKERSLVARQTRQVPYTEVQNIADFDRWRGTGCSEFLLATQTQWSSYTEIWFKREHSDSVSRPNEYEGCYEQTTLPAKQFSRILPKSRPDNLRKPRSYKPAQDDCPALVTIWEVPFRVEVEFSFLRTLGQISRGLKDLLGLGQLYQVGYTGFANFRTGPGRILVTNQLILLHYILDSQCTYLGMNFCPYSCCK